MPQNRSAWRRHRPAPRKAVGAPPSLTDTVTWTRIFEPRERYRILYRDRDGHLSERNIELMRTGTSGRTEYLGVMHAGKFKTLRVDRVASVLEQLSTGHPASIFTQPSYAQRLPAFPLANAVYKMQTVAVSKRTWTVDLNLYTCSCPEKRLRLGKGYDPGTLGYVCPHMARAILDYLPSGAADWTPQLLHFLANPGNVHIDNLV